MRDHLPADATIATRRIGVLAYYSHRKVFDYVYGLADPEVARLVARQGRRFDLPTERALAALWRARAPDYLLEDGSVMDLIMARTGGAYRRFAIHGLAYRVVDKFTIGTDVPMGSGPAHRTVAAGTVNNLFRDAHMSTGPINVCQRNFSGHFFGEPPRRNHGRSRNSRCSLIRRNSARSPRHVSSCQLLPGAVTNCGGRATGFLAGSGECPPA